MSWRHSFFGRAGPAALFVLLVTSPPASAAGCDSPVEPGERPRLEDYPGSREFLAAMMTYRQNVALQARQRQECPQLAEQPGGTAAHATASSTGAEDLDDAIARGRNQPPFDYARHPRWYNRTTSRTFDLPPLPPARMDERLIMAPIARTDERALPEKARNILVALRGPLDEVTSGLEAEEFYLRQFSDRLYEDEQRVAEASEPYAFTELVYYRNPAGTWLTFYYLDGELVHTAGFVAGCMSGQC